VDKASGYHGLIQEDERVVEVKPKIQAIGAEICAFRIINRHHSEAPFQVRFNFTCTTYSQLSFQPH